MRMKTSLRSTANSSGARPTGFPRTRIDDDPLSLFLWKLNQCYCRRVHNFSWQEADPLPSQGPAILVSNHRSSVDPFILAALAGTSPEILGFAQSFGVLSGLLESKDKTGAI